jgi:hypothetical protein
MAAVALACVRRCRVLRSTHPPGRAHAFLNAGSFERNVHDEGVVEDCGDFLPAVFLNDTRPTTNEDLVANRTAGYGWAGRKHKKGVLLIVMRPSDAFLSAEALSGYTGRYQVTSGPALNIRVTRTSCSSR